jgi:hypothetical protein
MRKYDVAVAWGNARLRALADLGVPIQLPESRWQATDSLVWQTNTTGDARAIYLQLQVWCAEWLVTRISYLKKAPTKPLPAEHRSLGGGGDLVSVLRLEQTQPH